MKSSLCVSTGCLGGYRSICRLLRQKYHVIVTHEMVRNILKQIDPVSVANRRRHRLRRRTYTSLGPNYMWHIDGYDKLRPYGILISGFVNQETYQTYNELLNLLVADRFDSSILITFRLNCDVQGSSGKNPRFDSRCWYLIS
jgi:hypothetical protein